jgi:hypothetical protein
MSRWTGNKPKYPTHTRRHQHDGHTGTSSAQIAQDGSVRGRRSTSRGAAVGYLVIGVRLAVVKWPRLFNHGPWELKESTIECLLVAMSFLALLGLRYPLRMLSVLLFEVAWKLIWLGAVAPPLWLHNKLDSATLGRPVRSYG